MKQRAIIILAFIWLSIIIFISAQPHLIIEPSKDLKDLRRIYQDSDLEIKGLDVVKEIINRSAMKTLPAIDRFLGFYGTRTSDLSTKFDFVVRKAGHWTVYFIFGLLVFNTLIRVRWKQFQFSPYAWTLSIGMLTAIIDESHQTLLSGRSGTVQDLTVDTAGVVIALIIIGLVLNYSRVIQGLVGWLMLMNAKITSLNRNKTNN